MTAEALQRLLDGYREALAARLLVELEIADEGATADGHEVAGLVAAMPRPPAPPPDPQLLALFRRWRTDRGLTPLRRLLARRRRAR